MEDEKEERNLLLQCAEWEFLLTLDTVPPTEKNETTKKLLKYALDNNVVPLYESVCETSAQAVDASAVSKMKTVNDDKIKELDAKIEDAEKNMGETEVRDLVLAKAKYYSSVADKEPALKTFEDAFTKSVGSNAKLEVVFEILQMAFYFSDYKLLKTEIERARGLIESGGDWERRNKLKVYEATYFMIVRDLESAANLFVDSVATFGASELFSFNEFIFYPVVTSMVSFSRVKLREKVVESPEILSVIADIDHLETFLESVYRCRYEDFFPSLSGIMKRIGRDRYLSRHSAHFLRSIRVIVYSQFLQSYQSVTVPAMAGKFGMSQEFIDSDLSRFISSGRLNAKIDKVRGIVETNRPDAKNAQYQSVVKQGDLLLNRVQKLSRVIAY